MKVGQRVRVHYTGTLDDGTVFDSSLERDPLEFRAGAGMMIPGFDRAVLEMELGEKKTVKIPAAQAYGEHNEDKVIRITRKNLQGTNDIPVGMQVMISGPDNTPLPGTIIDVDDEFVTVDFNHRLAGKDLTFEIELVEILDD